jgi:hypothetical protein
MGNKKRDRFRLLLRKYKLQSPPDEFTSEVIREIESMAGHEVYADETFLSVLKGNAPATPSSSFTYRVLNKTRKQTTVSVPPVITKKGWALIVGFVGICLIAAILMERSELQSSTTRYSIPVAEYLSNLTITIIEPLFYLAITIASACTLLWIDYVLTRNKEKGIRNK